MTGGVQGRKESRKDVPSEPVIWRRRVSKVGEQAVRYMKYDFSPPGSN